MKEKKKYVLQISLLLIIVLFSYNAIANIAYNEPLKKYRNNKIKVALLLDTSNSMDGLIAQAKSQLWSIINKLSEAKIEGRKPILEIALYEYGNDRLSSENGYIRRVLAFSKDLDLISEKLFALSTNGGSEYCGQVISKSVEELDWKGNDNDLKLIFIAGNEPFDQGHVSYITAAKNAIKKSIVINPIFCGNFNSGINTHWKEAADLTDGKYMSIEQNRKTVYINSPYDDEIIRMNKRLNDTYVPYGESGKSYKLRQRNQDSNAAIYGAANCVQRTVSKSKIMYNNSIWDLVDAVKDSKVEIEDVESKTLPKELQTMSKKELEFHINKKIKEREDIKNKINQLNIKREKFVIEKKKTMKNINNLGSALLKSIEKQAMKKGYEF